MWYRSEAVIPNVRRETSRIMFRALIRPAKSEWWQHGLLQSEADWHTGTKKNPHTHTHTYTCEALAHPLAHTDTRTHTCAALAHTHTHTERPTHTHTRG